MKQYLDLARKVLTDGVQTQERTGTNAIALFGEQMKFDLSEGFPLLTTKRVFWRGVVEELFWMLRGETNVRPLQEHGVRIWDEWADEHGNLGPVYGHQWRWWDANGKPIDQVKNLVDGLRENPTSRRHIVMAWNPADVDSMALPPCHCFFQFDTTGGKLNCQMYQRSADVFLGVPFNIASYALLTHIVARCVGLPVGTFTHTFGNVHIYMNHIEQIKEQLQRSPRALPKLSLHYDKHEYPWEYDRAQVHLDGYDPHPTIKGKVSV